MESVKVWHGRFGDPVPLSGPLPGVRSGNAVAYEFALPERFEPWPGRDRLERSFLLTDLGVGMAQPYWLREERPDGTVMPGLDLELGDGTSWYVDLLKVTDRGNEIIARDLYIDVIVPMDGRHQRILDLDEFGDALEDGMPVDVAVDGLRRWQRFLDAHLHLRRDPVIGWTDFPPRAIEELAALPSPLGTVVTLEF